MIRVKLLVAQRDYRDSVRQIGLAVTDSVAAETASTDAARTAQAAQDRTGASARALYHSGGPVGLFGSVLTSTDVTRLTIRLLSVRRVLSSADQLAQDAQTAARTAAARSTRYAGTARATVVTTDQIAQRAQAVDSLLAQAQARLARLSARAKDLAAAKQAQLALARAAATAAAERKAATGTVRAQSAPADYFALYRAAATTCPGMEWTLLAAVGQVESGHGRNVGPSSAGAIGPMQFMPRTFAAYGVDGNRDGRKDAFNPADAIYSAARYLCVNGAGSPVGIRRALFAYNRAQWYVDLVLGVQAQLVRAEAAAS